jgi:hypothetical protein
VNAFEMKNHPSICLQGQFDLSPWFSEGIAKDPKRQLRAFVCLGHFPGGCFILVKSPVLIRV